MSGTAPSWRRGRTSSDQIAHQGLLGDFGVIESLVTLVDEVQGALTFGDRGRRELAPSRGRFGSRRFPGGRGGWDFVLFVQDFVAFNSLGVGDIGISFALVDTFEGVDVESRGHRV